MAQIPPDPNQPNQGSVNYPRYNARPPGEIFNFDCIAPAWNILMKHPGTFALNGLIALVAFGIFQAISFVTSMGSNVAASRGSVGTAFAGMGANLVVGVACAIGSQTVLFVCSAGSYRAASKAIAGLPLDSSDGFNLGENASGVILASLLSGLIVTFGYYACCIPGLFLYPMVVFAPLLAMERNLPGGQAIAASFELAKPGVLMGALVCFCVGFLSGLGVFACIVGLVFTLPLGWIAYAMLFRDAIGKQMGEV